MDKKRCSFIPKSLRPDVVGNIIDVTHASNWMLFLEQIKKSSIKDIKQKSSRRILMAKIIKNCYMFDNEADKELANLVKEVFL